MNKINTERRHCVALERRGVRHEMCVCGPVTQGVTTVPLVLQVFLQIRSLLYCTLHAHHMSLPVFFATCPLLSQSHCNYVTSSLKWPRHKKLPIVYSTQCSIKSKITTERKSNQSSNGFSQLHNSSFNGAVTATEVV